jgi:hypothetical protein
MTSDGAYDGKSGLERRAMGEPVRLSAEPAAGKGPVEPLSSLLRLVTSFTCRVQRLGFFLSLRAFCASEATSR